MPTCLPLIYDHRCLEIHNYSSVISGNADITDALIYAHIIPHIKYLMVIYMLLPITTLISILITSRIAALMTALIYGSLPLKHPL